MNCSSREGKQLSFSPWYLPIQPSSAPASHQEMSHWSREPRTKPGCTHHRGPSPHEQWELGTACRGHSPFQVGSNPHIGHLPAHSCNEREENQCLPEKNRHWHQGQITALGAGLHGTWGKRQKGKPRAFPPPFTRQKVVRGQRTQTADPFTFHVSHKDVSICPLIDPMLEGAAFKHNL